MVNVMMVTKITSNAIMMVVIVVTRFSLLMVIVTNKTILHCAATLMVVTAITKPNGLIVLTPI